MALAARICFLFAGAHTFVKSTHTVWPIIKLLLKWRMCYIGLVSLGSIQLLA